MEQFVCGRKKHNCTTHDTFGPDIAGIGVVVSFFASALLSLVAMFTGYFIHGLAGVHYTEVDYLLTGRFKRRSERRKDFEGFILGLSDQQLVTGLAILVAAFSKCDITVYSFSLVGGIAWFSSTIHLATLCALRSYLVRHKLVLLLRTFGMLAVAGLLVAANIMGTTAQNAPPYLQLVSNLTSKGDDMQFYCVFRPSYDMHGLLTFNLITLVWLFVVYSNRIIALFSCFEPGHSRSHICQWLRKRFKLDLGEPSSHRVTAQKLRVISASNRNALRRCLSNTFHLISLAYRELRRSFWFELAWALFAGSYGLTKALILWLMQSHSVSLENLKSTALGFGQLVPLLLILLPIFAALEAGSDKDTDQQAHEEELATLPRPTRCSFRSLADVTSYLDACGDDPRKLSVYRRLVLWLAAVHCYSVLALGFCLASVASSIPWSSLLWITLLPLLGFEAWVFFVDCITLLRELGRKFYRWRTFGIGSCYGSFLFSLISSEREDTQSFH